MTDNTQAAGPGLAAIEAEMARQADDALASFEAARATAALVATAIRQTGRLLLLGMGASHAAGRIVEPLYRNLGVDAVALPLSEQLAAPLDIAGRTVIVASQSGESAEVVRWLTTASPRDNLFGMTLDSGSTLARAVTSLVGAGGAELAFAATRSLTVTLALHLAILAELGVNPDPALAVLRAKRRPDITAALAAFAGVRAAVCSGRQLQGVAEALALGICELARIPAFALEGGQFRHGPLEMLGSEVGVMLFRSRESGALLIANAAASAIAAGSSVVVFDCSDASPIPGAVALRTAAADGLAAAFALLPAAQRFMIELASTRVADVGTPLRSSKITRTE